MCIKVGWWYNSIPWCTVEKTSNSKKSSPAASRRAETLDPLYKLGRGLVWREQQCQITKVSIYFTIHSVRELLVMSSYLNASRAEGCRTIPECEREMKHADQNAYFSSLRSEMHAAGHERYQHFTPRIQKLDLPSPALSNKFVYTCSFDKYFSIHKLLVLLKYRKFNGNIWQLLSLRWLPQRTPCLIYSYKLLPCKML